MQAQHRIRTLADILPRRAAVTPGRTALQELAPGGALTGCSYGELARRADGLAARLREAGVGRGDAVALLMPNSSRWIVAYFAVHRIGAVAVPLEHGMLRTNPDRIAFALDHSEAAVVICEPRDAEDIRGLGRVRIASPDERRAGSVPQVAVRPSDVAQILYTSGTTGPRKGVVLTHANIIFDVGKCCERFGVRPADCLCGILPFHHAYPLTATVVLPLYAGARLAVGDVRDRRARTLLRRARPTVLVGVPRMFEAMLESVRSAAERAGRLQQMERARRLSQRLKDWTGLNVGRILFRRLHAELLGGLQLRLAVSGGARISPRLLREYFLLGIPLLQGWGMSELSPVGAVQQFHPVRFYLSRHYERKAGSIGTPLDGTRVTFAQSSTEELSFELEDRGEMLVSGPHVMRGYHRDPARTARQKAGDALRTGDVARRDADGNLYIVGRTKHVIVLPSGKKVFPEDELQEDISRCETIDEFAIRPITDADGRERIGIIVRPDREAVAGAATVGELYGLVKRDIDAALRGKPTYLRHYQFCLTPWVGDEFGELVKSALGEPCPLRNPFRTEAAYGRLRGSTLPAPWRA
jgi:long-chain acyl-CoA synthetase